MSVDDPGFYLQTTEWLKQIGDVKLSFEEHTVNNDPERRVLFDHALDVDFVILSRACLENDVKSKELGILSRGLSYDTWHSGCFLDQWAEDRVLQKLSKNQI